MRYIDKQAEPTSFTRWKSLANEDWTPTYDLLRGQIKRDVHQALLKEQHYLCCYCEQYVQAANSHIEHLQSQAEHPELALTYSNMLCSCGHSTYGIAMPQHCGNAKGDQRIPVTPLQPDCASRFTYESDGTIKEADESDTEAYRTLEILKLNADELKESRSVALEVFLNSEDIFLHNMSSIPHISFIKSILKID